MKKYLLMLLLFVFAFSSLHAQRDTEHWFAPMKASSGSSHQQELFFSTDSVTPFPITIYSNNVVLGTVTVSKGNPQTFAVPLDRIISKSVSDCFTVSDKGLYTQGDEPYFATLRFSISAHGEILTSKGKAGIGTNFFTVLTPITQSGDNFTTSVLATEDNTTVTISNYNPNILFSNGWTGTTNPQLTFVLNKGQSYIVEGLTSHTANRTGFIGAKIVADKPVSVTNGHFTGNYATVASTGTDIIMDQSVPTTRLGDEFVMVKGYGGLNDTTEGAMIVATENNTEIRLNGNATPVATINQGQWYKVPSNPYQNQGGGHYNMHIKTTKNVYVYQLLSGVAGSNNQSGFNYIPPLNCYLPRKIDELGLINQMPGASPTPTVKLNILTEKGATVTVNGATPTPAQGPYNVTGTSNWVSYSILGVSGNYTIVSSKAVTAGIAGGSGAMGYGGYFAGFSSIPLISKTTGTCIPGITLEVDDSYDSYQWYLNGVAIPGATSNTYTPTVAGNYTCNVVVSSCGSVTTPVYKVFTCLHESQMTITACTPVEIKPAFTPTNFTQTPVPSSVQIIVPPTNGTVTINPVSGVLTYTPGSGFVGNDTFTYKFCGDEPEFVDCEQVTVTVTVPDYPVVQDATLTECYNPDSPTTAEFDLTAATVMVSGGATYEYFLSYGDALNGVNMIASPTAHLSTSTDVYVRVYSPGGCYRIAKIKLNVTPPTYSTTLKDQYICAEGRATLDAGPDHDSYIWFDGQTTQTITGLTLGEYWVDLIKDGCTTRQTVKVYRFASPVISNIEISNNTATIIVTGGTAPYKYSMDNVNWQDSNVFVNLPRGQNTFYVKDANNCVPTPITVTVPNILNGITPNGDGYNDVLDYSALAYKENLTFEVFDRYGTKIHVANKDNGFKWNGKSVDRQLTTGTYWYVIRWNESNEQKTPVKFDGWVLVKN